MELETIEIPDKAREVKAWFHTRVDADAAVTEIHAYLKEGGKTFNWRGHTHTKPPPHARPVYIAEFVISDGDRRAKRWHPCPVCTSQHPKFGRGFIAWFPDEAVIRLIGRDCFQSLNPEAHRQAVETFREEQRVQKDVAFMAANLGKAAEALLRAEEYLLAGKALDSVGERLRQALSDARLDLMHHSRNGSLHVTVQESETYRTPDGEIATRSIRRDRVFAPLAGRRILDPGAPQIAPGLEKAVGLLTLVVSAAPKIEAGAVTDEYRSKAVRSFTRGMELARAGLAALDEVRTFFRIDNINAIRSWGRRAEAPLAMYIGLKDGFLMVGRNEESAVRLAVPTKSIEPMTRPPEFEARRRR